MDHVKPRVLVAERDAGFRGELKAALEEANCEVCEAAGGRQVIKMLAPPGEPPFELLLLDQSLPEIPGSELACTLHANNRHLKMALLKGVRDHKFSAADLPPGVVLAVLDKARPVEDLLYAVNNLLYVGSAGGRRWPRVPLRAMVQYRTERGWRVGRLWDLSHGGLQLRVQQGLGARTLLELKFFLPRLKESVKAQALVHWNRPAAAAGTVTGDGASCGLEFVDVSGEARQEIGTLVNRRLDELLHFVA